MPTKLLRIDEIWAWVGVDPADNTEGVCAVFMPAAMSWVPLIAADANRLDSIRDLARMVCDEEDRTLRLIKLSTREEIEEIHPTGFVQPQALT